MAMFSDSASGGTATYPNTFAGMQAQGIPRPPAPEDEEDPNAPKAASAGTPMTLPPTPGNGLPDYGNDPASDPTPNPSYGPSATTPLGVSGSQTNAGAYAPAQATVDPMASNTAPDPSWDTPSPYNQQPVSTNTAQLTVDPAPQSGVDTGYDPIKALLNTQNALNATGVRNTPQGTSTDVGGQGAPSGTFVGAGGVPAGPAGPTQDPTTTAAKTPNNPADPSTWVNGVDPSTPHFDSAQLIANQAGGNMTAQGDSTNAFKGYVDPTGGGTFGLGANATQADQIGWLKGSASPENFAKFGDLTQKSPAELQKIRDQMGSIGNGDSSDNKALINDPNTNPFVRETALAYALGYGGKGLPKGMSVDQAKAQYQIAHPTAGANGAFTKDEYDRALVDLRTIGGPASQSDATKQLQSAKGAFLGQGYVVDGMGNVFDPIDKTHPGMPTSTGFTTPIGNITDMAFVAKQKSIPSGRGATGLAADDVVAQNANAAAGINADGSPVTVTDPNAGRWTPSATANTTAPAAGSNGGTPGTNPANGTPKLGPKDTPVDTGVTKKDTPQIADTATKPDPANAGKPGFDASGNFDVTAYLKSQLANPSPYDDKTVTDLFNRQAADIQDQFDQRDRDLKDSMYSHGLGESSIYGGAQRNTNVARRSAQEDLNSNLAAQRAASVQQGQMGWLDRLTNAGNTAFNQDVTTQTLNQNQQDAYLRALLASLGA